MIYGKLDFFSWFNNNIRKRKPFFFKTLQPKLNTEYQTMIDFITIMISSQCAVFPSLWNILQRSEKRACTTKSCGDLRYWAKGQNGFSSTTAIVWGSSKSKYIFWVNLRPYSTKTCHHIKLDFTKDTGTKIVEVYDITNEI